MLRILAQEKGKVAEISRERLQKRKGNGAVWVDLLRPGDEEIHIVSKQLGISAADLKKHYFNADKRAGIIEINKYSLLTFNSPHVSHIGHVRNTLLAIFISSNSIFTIRNHEMPSFQRLGTFSQDDLDYMFSKGTGFILFSMIQAIIKDYFDIQDKLEEEIDLLEDKAFTQQTRAVTQEIFKVKKTLLFMRKSLNSNREAINYLQNGFATQIKEKDLHYFRIVYSDMIELVDLVAVYSDILSSIVETYLGSVSNNLNIIIKKMTALGSLVLIPTFLAGVYGMNFVNFPEIHWKYGYIFFWVIVLISVLILYRYFKKLGWL